MLQREQKVFTLLTHFSWQEPKTLTGTCVFYSCLIYINVHHHLYQHKEQDKTLTLARALVSSG